MTTGHSKSPARGTVSLEETSSSLASSFIVVLLVWKPFKIFEPPDEAVGAISRTVVRGFQFLARGEGGGRGNEISTLASKEFNCLGTGQIEGRV
jgi:hypothetical protein